MASICSAHTTILEIPPSCIEVCPWNQTFFAIGTYLLHKKESSEENQDNLASETQKRTGTIELFHVADDQKSTKLLYTQHCDYAILDLHFPVLFDIHEPCIWTANSTGSLTRHNLSSDCTSITGSRVHQLWEPDVLVLAFTFHPLTPNLLGATLSDGSVCLVQIPIGAITESQFSSSVIAKHDLEAWTMNFDLLGEKWLSGGDDAVLACGTVPNLHSISIEASLEETTEASLIWKNRRIHSAGVTAILPLDERVALSGSYDDHLRLVTLEKPPRVRAEVNLDGGVWRLKLLKTHRDLHTVRQYDILASCMHAGARIARITLTGDEEPHIEVLAKFTEHESMNYGSDFVCAKDNSYNYTILSTSFYDKRLCLWRF